MNRNIELSFKTFILLVASCAVTGLFVGGLGHYYGGNDTYTSNKKEQKYLNVIAVDSAERVFIGEALKAEVKATKFHSTRADKAEAEVRALKRPFDSLLHLSRIKSRPVVSKQDYINSEKWILDYNKNLKR